VSVFLKKNKNKNKKWVLDFLYLYSWPILAFMSANNSGWNGTGTQSSCWNWALYCLITLRKARKGPFHGLVPWMRVTLNPSDDMVLLICTVCVRNLTDCHFQSHFSVKTHNLMKI